MIDDLNIIKYQPATPEAQNALKAFLADPCLSVVPGVGEPYGGDLQDSPHEALGIREWTMNRSDFSRHMRKHILDVCYKPFIEELEESAPGLMSELTDMGYRVDDPLMNLTAEDDYMKALFDAEMALTHGGTAFKCYSFLVTPRQAMWRQADNMYQQGMLRETPWITDGAVSFLEASIKRGAIKTALEFGAGASTWWMASKGVNIVSVENSEAWVAATLYKLLLDGNRENVNLCFRNTPYYGICEEIREEGDRFDLILIDGRDRVKCAKASIDLLQPGGYLMLDNDERSHDPNYPGKYELIHDMLKGWKKESFKQEGPDTSGHVAPHEHITTVWHKPE